MEDYPNSHGYEESMGVSEHLIVVAADVREGGEE